MEPGGNRALGIGKRSLRSQGHVTGNVTPIGSGRTPAGRISGFSSLPASGWHFDETTGAGETDHFKSAQLGIDGGFRAAILHSTGQYHKGGPDSGFFFMVVADPVKDVEVESEATSFCVLERAQAIGDFQTLLTLGRRAYCLHLDSPRRSKDLMSVLLKIVEDL